MKRPAIQLYFGDLMKNPKVKRCGWAARGVLIWTMALLHDEEEYGAVRWPLIEIAQAVGCPFTLMRELADKGALKGGDKRVEAYRWAPSHAGKRGPEVILVPEQEGPLWYSSRMVRDEYKRTNRGVATRFGPGGKLPTGTPSAEPTRGEGGQHDPPNGTPSRREGGGASSSSSSSINGVHTPGIDARAIIGAKPLGEKSPSKTKPGNGWQRSRDGQLAMGEYLGLPPRRGEVEAEYKARLFDELKVREAAH